MQIAFGVFAWVFLRVRRKTAPTKENEQRIRKSANPLSPRNGHRKHLD